MAGSDTSNGWASSVTDGRSYRAAARALHHHRRRPARPPEESQALYARAGEPKKLVMLKGFGHYQVYAEPAFSEVMDATLEWYHRWLPAKAT